MIENRLKVILAERRLKIKNVVENTGLSRNTVSNIVNKPHCNISNKTLDSLCRYLEITPGDLLLYKKEEKQCLER